MKDLKVVFMVVVAVVLFSGSLPLEANAGDEKLKGYFVKCFLNEKDLGNSMVLSQDDSLQMPGQGGIPSGYGNLFSGYRSWSKGGHVFFTKFEENRSLFRSKQAAEKYYWGLIANNSMAKKPEKVIRGKFGDVCNVWIYPVGDPSNPDEYFTKYYIIDRNLITLIRAFQKPLPTPPGKTIPYDELLKRISPYIRLALIKSSMLLRHYDTNVQGNQRSPVSARGLNVRRYMKTQ